MRKLFIFIFALALPSIGPAACAATNIVYEANALTAAAGGLSTLKVLAVKDFAGLGFASTNEANMATVGTPIQVYRISLAPLQAYTTNVTYNGLLDMDAAAQTASRLIVPILVGTQTKSSITLRLDGPDWVVDKIGPADLIQPLISARGIVPATTAPIPPFAVEFPLFDMWFFAYYDATNDLKLITTRSMPLSPTIPANALMPRSAMYRIATIAQRYNENPN